MISESPDLSIIILNYNVKELLLNCLDSILKNKRKEDKWQVIVVDNASADGSVEAVKKKYGSPSASSAKGAASLRVDLIENQSNPGFAAGNNIGVKEARAPVILFLNPDTLIVGQAIQKSYQYLMGNPDIGALTCRVELPDGKLDYSCHRGFPTPWNSLMFFIGLSKIFPKSPLFAGYTATFLDTKTTHEIDCLTGAFMMVRKIAGEQANFWDEDYFFNGEDIEFCYRLKMKGWKIFFYPGVKIIHYKGSSAKQHRFKAVAHGVSAMRIFYLKHFYKTYPPVFRDVILAGIKILEHYRKFKIWVN